MSDLEHFHPEKELSKEQVQRLLDETVQWMDRLIDEKPHPNYPMAGRAAIADPESDVSATVTVGDLVTGYMVEYLEHNHTDNSRDISIEFSLTENRDGEYQLMTTGEQPDIVDALLEQDDVDDDAFTRAVQAAQELQAENERPATQAEIKQFHTILELAMFGDKKFDFDTFQWQYDDYVEGLREIQEAADKLEKQINDEEK